MSSCNVTHGGMREGSGRKSREDLGLKPLKAITVKVEPEIHDKFTVERKENGLSESKQFSKMVEAL